MGDGRRTRARERAAKSPALLAGLFLHRRAALGRRLRRPLLVPLALAGYRRERVTEISFPVAAAMMEGGFLGVVAAKIFEVQPAVLALISAAPMFGNLSSFVWARLANGRRKVPFILGLQISFAALVAAVAFLPVTPLGTALLVAALIAARLVFGGILTLRSLVWSLNYPREVRGRVTARLAMLTTGTLALTSAIGGALLDADPERFRMLYVGGAAMAGVGVLAFSRVPVLGEARHRVRERADGRRATRERSVRRRRRLLGLLRSDPLYARYQAWQFLLGVSNMMIEAPLIYLVSVQLQLSYTQAIGVTQVLPLGLAVLTIPLWASYLDRVHIAEFRSRHSWLFAFSLLLLWGGAALHSLALIAAARAVLGLARGGGMLAWYLGHNDFADSERMGLYMGVHVTLTGLRGAVAPFVGMLLYVGWSATTLPGTGVTLPGFEGVGTWLMLAASLLSSVAAFGYLGLHRRIRLLDAVRR